ncbi:lung adenoma susceptibility protein 2 isoform X2 [Mastacembelus armatus]|uniref:lung adenoma susceptibility protein 2 isoform X2 n=1 Tax=Mastacembelus armatus TaxID=205130 RepID=UPI000E455D4F|nr:lung adenoma susceptibility protein 2 isoform X2 [Mastacembelus armatus]
MRDTAYLRIGLDARYTEKKKVCCVRLTSLTWSIFNRSPVSIPLIRRHFNVRGSIESSRMLGDVLSPESTVTSLLSSSGHLKSSLRPPEHNTTFRYRDKNYDSASAVLDAYIEDFEMSHHNGRLVLPHSPPSTPKRLRVNTLRNKDVLRESLTDRELDFLNLPISSLCHRDNRDRLSMTTDELLSIPYDGSMPVTHTSAFLQGLLSQSGPCKPCCSSSRPGYRVCAGLSNSYATPQLNHHYPHLIRTPRSSRGRPDAVQFKKPDDIFSVSSFKFAHRASGSEWANLSSSLHLPHWFSSNKADTDSSGMSRGPDLRHPAWLQCCDLSEPLPSPESELWDGHGPRIGAPSWVAELEDDDPDQKGSQDDSQQSLRDLRLQFAEQISQLAAERKSSDIMETLSRDNRIESLIQKADQVLNSLSQSSAREHSPTDSVSPKNTEELLLSSSSHRPLNSLDSTAAEGVTEALTDRGTQTTGSSLHGNTVWKQPGPVEALKQMLFRLQAVESELHRQQQASVAPTVSDRLQTVKTPITQTAEGESELERVSGGQSLQRALHHLSRLKLLVEEPREKHKEEEKDDDEGHYSSTSAEGLNCTQQKPSCN